ncbi:hypothetical protein C8F04DRAFT_1311553 [Mycena alexandri]|uniref:Uncharacterized protein n=1 Tax=Mycena alexandri TaxID=1745969 RepID=A0AAD6WRB4_9AGAR|nr:hypothetical protein C8F04DRAFT_1311553 [Mycena alexandri]
MHSLSLITLVLTAASAILAHAPVKSKRSEGLLTNAQRLKRGLPPLPPVARWSPTRHALVARASPVPCTTQTISGLIEVTDDISGTLYGYVTTDYFLGYSTFDPTEDPRTVSITIPCNPSADDLVGLNIASLISGGGGTNDHPYFGAIMSYDASDNDLSSANANYAWMGTTDLIPTVTSNSAQDAQGAKQASESPVWTYDPATGALTLTWYNTDGSAATTYPVKVDSLLFATENVQHLAARLNRSDLRVVNYRLVQTTVVQNR